MKGIRVIGTGRYIPETVVTNDDMAKMVDTNDEWISTRTGIKTRCMVKGEPTSYMALQAARAAIARAGIGPEEIGLIICSTITPDFYTPSVSCLVQGELGAKGAMSMDIACACSGFVYAMDIAQKYLCTEDSSIRYALIVSSESLSHIANFEDRATCVLFGDGAGACVVQAADKRFASFLGADGTGAKFLYASQVYPRTPFEAEQFWQDNKAFPYEADGFLHMDGKEVYKFSTAAMAMAVRQACQRMKIEPEDLRLIVPHQANVRIVRTGMKHLGLPEEKAFMNIEKFGNTSSATIPIALDEAVRLDMFGSGDLVAFVGFGAGLTYGAVILEW